MHEAALAVASGGLKMGGAPPPPIIRRPNAAADPQAVGAQPDSPATGLKFWALL